MYRIRDWDKIFEINRTREVKFCRWVAMPNRHDTAGYRALVSRPDGPALYGTWCVLVQIASRCFPRGSLIRDDGTPHTPESLAFKSGFPAELIRQCLEVVQTGQISWIQLDTDNVIIPQEGATTSQEGATTSQEGATTSQVARARDTGHYTTLQNKISVQEDFLYTEQDPKPETDARISAPENGAVSRAQRTAWFKTEFWIPGVVWKRIGTGKALESWLKAVHTREEADLVIAAAQQQSAAILAHAATNGHSVLNPATWLNQKRWLDDPEAGLPLVMPADRREVSKQSAYDAEVHARLKDAAIRQSRPGSR